MTKLNLKTRISLTIAPLVLALHFAAPVASACSVCFGDKDDPMVKGTANGVLVMIGITYGMLLGMGALAATWFVRNRRIRALDSTIPTAPDEK